jgi:acetylglutamate/LysW-gamma-L-alpha-aminoadipate kinase
VKPRPGGDGVLVVKVGGAAGIDQDALSEDVARLWHGGTQLVLVHGGSAETNELSTLLGHPPRFITSPGGHTSRFTDRATLEIFTMACARVNRGIVERLQRMKVNAVGLSGLDGRIFEGRRKGSVRSVEDGRTIILHGDHTGTVDTVNAGLIQLLLASGYLPVLGPPGISTDGTPLNVDADRAAAALAVALRARTLLLLSNVPGLLAEFPDEASLIQEIPAADLDRFMDVAEGRMKKKLLGAAEALRGGVDRVTLGDARCPQPVTYALEGNGTVIG